MRISRQARRVIGASLGAGAAASALLVGMAPYFDCAERLGVDPVALFDGAAKDLGPKAHDLAHEFVRRSDIDLLSFGWVLTDTADGPCYRPTA